VTTRSIEVQRLIYTSSRSFADVLAELESKIGHPEMSWFKQDYDTMAGYLASYGNPDALKVARDLDSKVKALLAKAAE
jgi:hypothetical protein